MFAFEEVLNLFIKNEEKPVILYFFDDLLVMTPS